MRSPKEGGFRFSPVNFAAGALLTGIIAVPAGVYIGSRDNNEVHEANKHIAQLTERLKEAGDRLRETNEHMENLPHYDVQLNPIDCSGHNSNAVTFDLNQGEVASILDSEITASAEGLTLKSPTGEVETFDGDFYVESSDGPKRFDIRSIPIPSVLQELGRGDFSVTAEGSCR